MYRLSGNLAHLSWGMAGFLFIAFLSTWFALYLIRDRSTPREPPSHACRENIGELVQAQIKWAEDHGGLFSDNLSDLYPDYVSSLRTFQCPSRISEPLFDEENIDLKCDYEMVRGLGTSSPGDRILIYDKEGNHKHARNVGFVNGSVEEIHEFRFREKMKQQEEQSTGEKEK